MDNDEFSKRIQEKLDSVKLEKKLEKKLGKKLEKQEALLAERMKRKLEKKLALTEKQQEKQQENQTAMQIKLEAKLVAKVKRDQLKQEEILSKIDKNEISIAQLKYYRNLYKRREQARILYHSHKSLSPKCG